jgi:hypothetical protein
MSVIQGNLTTAGLEPTQKEVMRQYDVLREKYGGNPTAEWADRELRGANALADDGECILETLEWYLTREWGRKPTEQQVTELYRVYAQRYGRPLNYRVLAQFLDELEQLQAIREYKLNWFDRAAEAVRTILRKLFVRHPFSDS